MAKNSVPRERVLKLLAWRRTCTAQQAMIAVYRDALTKTNKNSTYVLLRKLEAEGIVQRVGSGKPLKWELTNHGKLEAEWLK